MQKFIFAVALSILSCALRANRTAGSEAADPKIDGRNVTEWSQLLLNGDEKARQHAARVLARAGPKGIKAAGSLLLSLADEAEYVRRLAAFALSQMAPEVANYVPDILGFAEFHPDSEVASLCLLTVQRAL
jgi:hypothetical protein